jgi:hypothetical protein
MTAAHGADVVALGVTADGAAAASADRIGGLRLWPTLDGTREPVVIQGTAARAITVARDGDGFVIGTLDAAGGVHLIRTSATGAVRGRATASDKPAAEIHRTSEGLLVLRADQTLELIDSRGAVRSRLHADTGTHIDSILVRGRHVLALIQEDKQLHGRRIVIDHGAAWGASTPRFRTAFEQAALSPDGDLLAVRRPRSVHPVLIDLATGAVRSTALCVAKEWPQSDGGEDSSFLRGDNAPTPIAFLTAETVACTVAGTLHWWRTSGAPEEVSTGAFHLRDAPIAATERALIAGIGTHLVIATPARSRFLGYGVNDVSQIRIAPDGVLVAGSDQQALVLDTHLRERSRFDLGRARISWGDAVLVDDRWAIVAQPAPPPLRSGGQIAVVDGVTRVERQILSYEVRDGEMAYEPSTRLLAASDGAASLILAFDPASHTFGAPIRLASAITPTRIALVDPALAGGLAALAIDVVADGLLVGELHRDDMTPGTFLQPRATYRVPGELRAVDRAGRLYVRVPDENDVVVYARGVAGARLPGAAKLTLRPNADGSRIAAFDAPRLMMFGADGALGWDASPWDSADVAWLGSGELVVQFPSAIAKVDLDTGALAERRCGLAFGLSETPFQARHVGSTVCELAH